MTWDAVRAEEQADVARRTIARTAVNKRDALALIMNVVFTLPILSLSENEAVTHDN